MKRRTLMLWLCLHLLGAAAVAQNIAINATGNLPDPKAILDITSTTSGLLIPRMSTAERDAIASPPNGLQVYNTTTNTLDIYRGTRWEQTSYADAGVILVRSLADLPAPVNGGILLDSTKTYKFCGLVDISPNYLNTNGAAVVGTNPVQDGIQSTVSGAILRSTNKHVYLEKILIIPGAASTKAFDFSDVMGLHSCNFLTGVNVKDGAVASAGVGQVSGFRAVIILQNYWSTASGLKVTGNMGRFICGFTLISGITNGAGIEFLPGLTIDDIDLSNNHFVYTGQTGVKVCSGAIIDRGRMTTNIFRGMTVYLDGFDSYTPAWEMQQNTNVPNSKAFAYAYMNENATVTNLPNTSTYYKIAGNTTALSAKRFMHTDNRFTYTGKHDLVARLFVSVGGKSPANSADFSIAIAKNGVVMPYPKASMGAMTNNQGFQITLESEVDLMPGDYVEVFIKRNNAAATAITISDLQFRIRD